MKGMKP
jgi:hypothetical protein